MKDMLGREELIPVERALQMLLQYAPYKKPPESSIPIESAYGAVLSRDILSPEDLPGFSRSTVDGFAVRSQDTFGATEGLPAHLTVDAEIPMGEKPGVVLLKGICAKIATGGMLPEGADAVVMLEYTQQFDEKTVEVVRPVSPGENVIQAGEYARKDERVLKSGHRLHPQDVGALAGLGITQIWTYEKPKVSIISTGDEIVAPSEPVRALPFMPQHNVPEKVFVIERLKRVRMDGKRTHSRPRLGDIEYRCGYYIVGRVDTHGLTPVVLSVSLR